MRRSRKWIAVPFLIVASACSSDSTAPNQDPCLLGREMTVIAMEPARFSWDACGMAVLYVRPEAGGTITWWIESDTNSIQAPVTYGVVPDGSIQLTTPAPLQEGLDYRVTIVRRHGTGTNDLTAVGAKTFTFGRAAPPPAVASPWRSADFRRGFNTRGPGLELQPDAKP